MIFQSNTPHSITPQKHDIFSFSYMKNIAHPQQKPQISQQIQQNNSCFCFKSSKKHRFSSDSDLDLKNLPQQSLKEQALRLSQQIAQKSFRHLKNGHLSAKNSFSQNITLETTKLSFQNSQKQQLGKNPAKNVPKKVQRLNESEKDEFNMSRLTFSVVNRSYEKTVNNTVSSNNTSMISESNILSSMISQVKNDGEKGKSHKQSHDESFSSISSINKRGSGKGLRSQMGSKKGIRVLKTKTEIQPIKEENEQVQTKKFKFIRVKAKDLPPKPTQIKEEKILSIRKIQTEEKLQSSQSGEQQDNIKYDYSSVVIDFFNIEHQNLQEIDQNKVMQNILEPQSDEANKNNTTPPNNMPISLSPQASSISRQTLFSSLTSYNQVQSISNIRSSFGQSVSLESNVLSMSINNNLSECSFESIAKKQIKWAYKGYGGFDGLSCINENEESEVEGRNQSKVEHEEEDGQDLYDD